MDRNPARELSEADELAEFLAQMAFLLPNFNDTFAYASADTERITVGDGKVMAQFWRDHGWYGMVAIAAAKRGTQPVRQIEGHPRYRAAVDALMSPAPVDEEEDDEWTLRDEFELR